MTPTRPSLALRAAAAAAVLVFLAGCASTPPPTSQMAVSNAALAQAVASGSVEYAPREMGMARDKMARANLAMVAKDHDMALSLAQEAQVDAQLAASKTEAAKAKKAAAALDEASRALREEMNRKTN